MGGLFEKRFTWDLEKFSRLQDQSCYSLPFGFAGWNWHIIAYPKSKGYGSCKHLSLYLGLVDTQYLPLGWKKEVKFRLTVVNNISKYESKVLEGKRWFTANHHTWGFEEFLPLFQLRSRDYGFLVGDKLVIVAELHVFPDIVVPKGTLKINEPLSSKEGNQPASGASQENLDEDASEASLDDDGTSEEDLDEDDASEEGSDDDDASSPVYDDEGKEKIPLNQSKPLNVIVRSLTSGNHGMRCNSLVSETKVSNVDDDDAPRQDSVDDDSFEDVKGDDDASSLALSDSEGDVSSVKKLKSTVDASQTVENDDTGCNKVASVTEASNDLCNENQTVKETMDVNGFQVFASQVQSVRRIFERHPDIAVEFRAKNRHLRTTLMNFLLNLIETLYQPLQELSNEDLVEADIAVTYLEDSGFKVDWLEKKLDQIKEKKEKERSCEARVQELEVQLHDLKHKYEMEKAELSDSRAPLSFDDIV